MIFHLKCMFNLLVTGKDVEKSTLSSSRRTHNSGQLLGPESSADSLENIFFI